MMNNKPTTFTLIILIFLQFSLSSNLFSQNDNMAMYQSKSINGCQDFHCTKCSNRDNCSLGYYCSKDGCGHKHGIVSCGEGVLFYLRSSNGYANQNGEKDCEVRAHAIAQTLNSSMQMMSNHDDCTFIVRNEKGDPLRNGDDPTIWLEMKMGHNKKIVTITNSDMIGYKSRAKMLAFSKMAKEPGSITKKMVAYWWANNLEDHFAMMVLNKEPSLTINTHCGKVLLKVWNNARTIIPEGKIPMKTFASVMQNLSAEEKKHLKLAAQIIPKNYKPIIIH